MRLFTLVLAALLLVAQYPLWLGKGGWLRVWDLDRQLQAHNRTNDELKRRNDKLAAEVKDLKEGAGAVEERARYELGMLREGEMFVEVTDPGRPARAPGAAQKPVNAPPTDAAKAEAARAGTAKADASKAGATAADTKKSESGKAR